MKKILILFVSTLILVSQYSCINKEFDEPEFTTPVVDFVSTHTIPQLKALCTGEYKLIEQDIIIRGEVISEDLSGNFYKTVVIQNVEGDARGGITVKVETTGLYNNYPIGQEIYIKCKGLTLGKYGGEVQLGGSWYFRKEKDRFELAGIPRPLLDDYVFLNGERKISQVKEISDFTNLLDEDKFTLVKFVNVEFNGSANANQTWSNTPANPVFPFVERELIDGSGNTIMVFTSDFAKFSSEKTPTGKISISGIVGAHKGKKQFLIRNLNDITAM